KADPIFVTKDEYARHLRSYIVATGVVEYDPVTGRYSIISEEVDKVRAIINDPVEPRVKWENEKKWFEYYGDPSIKYPPIDVAIKLSDGNSPLPRTVVQVRRNGQMVVDGLTSSSGIIQVTIFAETDYSIRLISNKGKQLLDQTFRIMKGQTSMNIIVPGAVAPPAETTEVYMQRLRELAKGKIDEEFREKLELRKKYGR
ncbi:MAG: hypothetical protein ACYCPP_05610, partial [Nitrososphaerales archaeon]